MHIQALEIRAAIRAGEDCAVLARDQDQALAREDWKMVTALAELADWQGCRVYQKIYIPAPSESAELL